MSSSGMLSSANHCSADYCKSSNIEVKFKQFYVTARLLYIWQNLLLSCPVNHLTQSQTCLSGLFLRVYHTHKACKLHKLFYNKQEPNYKIYHRSLGQEIILADQSWFNFICILFDMELVWHHLVNHKLLLFILLYIFPL